MFLHMQPMHLQTGSSALLGTAAAGCTLLLSLSWAVQCLSHDMACWLSKRVAGNALLSMGLLQQDVWELLRAAEPCHSDSKLLAFLKLVAAGYGYQNVAPRHSKPHPSAGLVIEVPGQQL